MSLPPVPLLLGCIADDFTGATDLASMLVRHGMATTQLIGVPAPDIDPGDAQAIVVALKSRTIAGRGCDPAVAGGARVAARRAARILFKYCSTFDSTAEAISGRSARRCSRHLEPR